MDAFESGAEAYRRGEDVDMNPYDDRDAQFDEWEDGWGMERIEDELATHSH